MARAEQIFEDKEVVTIEKTLTGVNLHLSLDEAQRIKDILGEFAGSGSAGWACNSAYDALERAGIDKCKYHVVQSDKDRALKLNYISTLDYLQARSKHI